MPNERGSSVPKIVFIHNNPAAILAGRLVVDRKFLTGMALYQEALGVDLVSVHPMLVEGAVGIDMMEVNADSVPFKVHTIRKSGKHAWNTSDMHELERHVRDATLVYGNGFASERLCMKSGTPFIGVLEYDLRTEVMASISQVGGLARRTLRGARVALKYLRAIRWLRKAEALHCNGYPVYHESGIYHKRRLLYLDSRVRRADVVPSETLESRLSERRNTARPLRVLFSGRYVAMKGALESVEAACRAVERGANIKYRAYGAGPLAEKMAETANARGKGNVTICGAITYPELHRLAQSFDLFLCCHVQGDPSCTYLEALGAGLPILGFANRMWRNLCADSGAGWVVAMGDIEAAASLMCDLASGSVSLDEPSRQARAFALDHCFEAEFSKRTNDIARYLSASGASDLRANIGCDAKNC